MEKKWDKERICYIKDKETGEFIKEKRIHYNLHIIEERMKEIGLFLIEKDLEDDVSYIYKNGNIIHNNR